MTEKPSFLTWFIQDVFGNEKLEVFRWFFDGYAMCNAQFLAYAKCNIWDFECIKGTRIISEFILETFKICWCDFPIPPTLEIGCMCING